MIKAVIFDIDGVLEETLDANIKFYEDLMKNTGYPKPSRKILEKSHHLTMWDTIALLTKENSKDKIMKIWDIGRYADKHDELKKFPENFLEVIKKLSRKYKLGIVTGRVRHGADNFLRRSKTGKYFSSVVSFEDYQKAKPDPEPLLVAAKKLKILPNEAVYIGDALSDRIAAKAAGIKFIFYSNCVKGAVRNFKQLADVIENTDK